MTLTFLESPTTDIKALARLRRISPTDKTAMAAMIGFLVASELDRYERSTPPQEKGATVDVKGS